MKSPLFHVVKREQASPAQQLMAYVAAVILALAVGAVLLSVQGVEPVTFYRQLITMGIPGSRYPWRAVENFIRLFVPLLIVSLALSLAFKMRFWNIGGEGQFIMGAFWAAVAAMKLGESLPKPLMVVVMALCGAVGGGLYGVFVAALKVKWGTNETLLTLMLNYVALYFLQFFAETKGEWNFFLDRSSARPRFAKFPESAQMVTIPIGPFNLNLSLVAALVLCVILFVYLNYTKRGYEIAVVGDSPNTARYAGMKVGKIVIRTIFLSAALIGGLLLSRVAKRLGGGPPCLLRRSDVRLAHQRCGVDRRGCGLAGQAEYGGHCAGLAADYRVTVRLPDGQYHLPLH